MVHGCRVCEGTLEKCSTDFSTVLVDVAMLKTEMHFASHADASLCLYQSTSRPMLKPATYDLRFSASACFRLTD